MLKNTTRIWVRTDLDYILYYIKVLPLITLQILMTSHLFPTYDICIYLPILYSCKKILTTQRLLATPHLPPRASSTPSPLALPRPPPRALLSPSQRPPQNNGNM